MSELVFAGTPETSSQNVNEALAQYQRESYRKLQEAVGLRVEALDETVADAYRYFDGLGLQAPPLIFFDSRDPASLAHIATYDKELTERLSKGTANGAHNVTLNIAFVDPNQAGISTIAHELSHGTEMHTYRVLPGSEHILHRIIPVRSGWNVVNERQPNHSLMNEARAEFLGHHFVDLHDDSVSGSSFPSLGFWLPKTYLKFIEEKTFSVEAHDLGAVAWDLLVAHNPKMLDIVLHGCTSTEGLKQTVAALNNVAPNFYQTFARLPYMDADPADAARLVRSLISQLHGGNEQAPVHAHLKVRGLLRKAAFGH